MRADTRPRERHELVLFLLVGLTVAVPGHGMLLGLVAAGWVAWLANTTQALVTLQLNFAFNRQLTWRRRLAGSPQTIWVRWWRFHAARGAGAVLSIAAFPVLSPHLGHTGAYWTLLGLGAGINFSSDRHWSFAHHRASPGVRLTCVGGVVVAGV